MRPTEAETPQGRRREPPCLGAIAGKGLAQGGTARGEARRCRGGATRDGDLNRAEARSRPDEPKPKPAERETKGATGKGALALVKPLPKDPRGNYARAGGR